MTAITDLSHRPTWWERALELVRAFFAPGKPGEESKPIDARELGIYPRDYMSIGHG
ncbi:hypothetical protein [Amaricoccus sp.]|uniref:hypothetical protein n=1 Tax=Amaricoccus sp. TaxID=1872485 RepID=UPI002617F319|nr:hypothetical protein [Amaricoccus sp.]HRO11362.1 hypothetical protein [Amaricoccus sp.]